MSPPDPIAKALADLAQQMAAMLTHHHHAARHALRAARLWDDGLLRPRRWRHTMSPATLPTPIHQIQFPHSPSRIPSLHCGDVQLHRPGCLSGCSVSVHNGNNVSVWVAVHQCPRHTSAQRQDRAGSCRPPPPQTWEWFGLKLGSVVWFSIWAYTIWVKMG
jgi:hypothetical protein